MSDKTPKPAPKAPGQKMSAEDCKRLGLDPSVYGHKAKR